MKFSWSVVARHYLQVIAFCFVIAVLTTLIWPSKGYLAQLGYSLTVGTVVWAVGEFGRLLVPAQHCRRTLEGGHGWPIGWRGGALTALSIVCGFVVGDQAAGFFFGQRHMSSASSMWDNRLSMLVTVVAAVVVSFYFHSRGKAAALQARVSAAERGASEARLKLLETQIEPHMLFNTLANLRALITLEPKRAVEMLDHLNSYLRVTLSGSRALAHPLSAEFDRIGDYLALMTVRMGPRLHYALDLPDALRDVPVPPLLLQPLVENSIRHGLEPQIEGGSVLVRAWRDGTQLVIEIVDTGVGIDPAQAIDGGPANDGFGFGVAQVRERLAGLHGGRASLTLARPTEHPERGTRATLRFPMQMTMS